MRREGPPSIEYNGRRAWLVGSPLPEWHWKDDNTEVPPEIVPELNRRHAQRAMVRAGLKPAGAPRKKLTKGEQRRALCALGHTPEALAAAEGVELETVLRSMRPSRTDKRGGQ